MTRVRWENESNSKRCAKVRKRGLFGFKSRLPLHLAERNQVFRKGCGQIWATAFSFLHPFGLSTHETETKEFNGFYKGAIYYDR